MSFGELALDLQLRIMKSLTLGNTRSDAIKDLLACERTCRALRTAARDESVWQCISLMSSSEDATDELLETTYAAAPDNPMGTDGHRMKQLLKQAWRQHRLQQKFVGNLVGEVFDPGVADALGPNWQEWCNKVFHRLNTDERLVETTLLLTQRAAQLVAYVAEDQLIRFMRACLECSAERQKDRLEAPAQFELARRDVSTVEKVQYALVGDDSALVGDDSGGIIRRRGLPWIPGVIEGDVPPQWLRVYDDGGVGKKLIVRLARRAGILRMNFDCFEPLFQRFQRFVAKVLVPAAILAFEISRPKTALEVLEEAELADDEEEGDDVDDEDEEAERPWWRRALSRVGLGGRGGGDDDDGDEEEEEDDDDDDDYEDDDDDGGDDDDDDESEEDETDPFDVAYLPGAQAPGTLVVDKASIARFAGKFYGFSTTWARTGPDE